MYPVLRSFKVRHGIWVMRWGRLGPDFLYQFLFPLPTGIMPSSSCPFLSGNQRLFKMVWPACDNWDSWQNSGQEQETWCLDLRGSLIEHTCMISVSLFQYWQWPGWGATEPDLSFGFASVVTLLCSASGKPQFPPCRMETAFQTWLQGWWCSV